MMRLRKDITVITQDAEEANDFSANGNKGTFPICSVSGQSASSGFGLSIRTALFRGGLMGRSFLGFRVASDIRSIP